MGQSTIVKGNEVLYSSFWKATNLSSMNGIGRQFGYFDSFPHKIQGTALTTNQQKSDYSLNVHPLVDKLMTNPSNDLLASSPCILLNDEHMGLFRVTHPPRLTTAENLINP